MDDVYDDVLEKFEEVLGFFGEDDTVELQRVIDYALDRGLSMKEIKEAASEARREFL